MSALISQLQLCTNPLTANTVITMVYKLVTYQMNFHRSFVQPFRSFIRNRNIRCF